MFRDLTTRSWCTGSEGCRCHGPRSVGSTCGGTSGPYVITYCANFLIVGLSSSQAARGPTPPTYTNARLSLNSIYTPNQSHARITAKMVKLEEVMDEEFVREQEGPHDDDEWDTDSGTTPRTAITGLLAHRRDRFEDTLILTVAL